MGKNFRCGIITEIELELRDKDGKLLSKRRMPSKSLLRNFLKLIRDYMRTQTGTLWTTAISTYLLNAELTLATVKNLANADTSLTTARGWNAGAVPMPVGLIGLDAEATNSDFGLVVGSGTVAVTPTDYNLAGKYVEGSGSGQLQHGAVTIEDVAIDGMTTRFRVIRTFTNAYTSPQTVAEIGLIMRYRDKYYYLPGGSGTTRDLTLYSLLARDVLSPPQSVPVGATLTVRYIFSVTA